MENLQLGLYKFRIFYLRDILVRIDSKHYLLRIKKDLPIYKSPASAIKMPQFSSL